MPTQVGSIVAPIQLDLSGFTPAAQRAEGDLKGLGAATDAARAKAAEYARAQGAVAAALRTNEQALTRVYNLLQNDPTDASRERILRLGDALIDQRKALVDQGQALQTARAAVGQYGAGSQQAATASVGLTQAQGQLAIALRENSAQLQRAYALLQNDPTDASRARIERLTGSLLQQKAALQQQARGFEVAGRGATSANRVLTDTGRIVQDLQAAKFGGLQGAIGATANNVQPLVESFAALRLSAQKSGQSLASVLIPALTGPAGLGVAVAAATTAYLLFGDAIGKAIRGDEGARLLGIADGAREVADAVRDATSALISFETEGGKLEFTTRDQAEAYVDAAKELKDRYEAALTDARNRVSELRREHVTLGETFDLARQRVQELEGQFAAYSGVVESAEAALRSFNAEQTALSLAQRLAPDQFVSDSDSEARKEAERERQRAQRRAETEARQAARRAQREAERAAREQADLAARVPNLLRDLGREISAFDAALQAGLVQPFQRAEAEARALEQAALGVLAINEGRTSAEFERLAERALSARAAVDALREGEEAYRRENARTTQIVNGIADGLEARAAYQDRITARTRLTNEVLDESRGIVRGLRTDYETVETSVTEVDDAARKLAKTMATAKEVAEDFGQSLGSAFDGFGADLADLVDYNLFGGAGDFEFEVRLATASAEEQLASLAEQFREGEIDAETYALRVESIERGLRDLERSAPSVANAFGRMGRDIIAELTRVLVKTLAVKAALAALNLIPGFGASGIGGAIITGLNASIGGNLTAPASGTPAPPAASLAASPVPGAAALALPTLQAPRVVRAPVASARVAPSQAQAPSLSLRQGATETTLSGGYITQRTRVDLIAQAARQGEERIAAWGAG